jgi:hypothetical protein
MSPREPNLKVATNTHASMGSTPTLRTLRDALSQLRLHEHLVGCRRVEQIAESPDLLAQSSVALVSTAGPRLPTRRRCRPSR